MTTLVKMFRLTVLLVILGGAFITFVVNGNVDPRFYRFLNSGTGRAVANIMGWSADFSFLPADKPEKQMTRDEVAMKRRLEDTVETGLPRHRLVLRSGEVLSGEVVRKSDVGDITFLQSFGDAGSFCAYIPEHRVLRLEDSGGIVPRITYRDVLFSMEFPDLTFYRRPPYTIMTDQNYLQVERAVKDLQRLHFDFARIFNPLITLPERGEGIQLLFFQDEDRYTDVQRGFAPQLEHSAGFYSPRLDRFVVFNQVTSRKHRSSQLGLTLKRRAYQKRNAAPDQLGRVKDWQIQAGRSILQYAEEQTRMTVRHEGSHQLFFTYGVHSRHHAENSWLIEGLASYCETAPPGGAQPKRLALLKKYRAKGGLIPLAELVNSRSPRGLFAFWGEKRVQLAYAESWGLVSYLMRQQYRGSFFDYMEFVRDAAHIDELAATPRIEVLARSLGMEVDELEKSWDRYIAAL